MASGLQRCGCEGKVRKWEQILPDTWLSWAERRRAAGGGFGVKGEFIMVFCACSNSAPGFMHMNKGMFESSSSQGQCKDGPHRLPQKQWRTPRLSRRDEGGEEVQNPREGNYERDTNSVFLLFLFRSKENLILCC